MLKIKNTPKTLNAHRFDLVWPGDDAVDLKSSDLISWMRHGGRNGLVMKETGEPAIITCRPLVERELALVLPLLHDGSPNACAEVFRYGVVSISGFPLRREKHDGVSGITDSCLDQLAEEVLPLRFLPAYIDAVSDGETSDWENSKDMDTALPWAIGVHILGATFRKSRRAV